MISQKIFQYFGVILLLLIILVFLIFYKPIAVSADSVFLFSDGFESDGFGNWASAGSHWKTVKKASNARSGEYRAEVKGNTSGDSILLNEKSTAGFKDVKFSFWHKISQKLESDDHVFFEWSGDGINWNQIANFSSISAGDWTKNEKSLPADADDNSGFRFRFLANLDGGSDVFWLDDIELYGNIVSSSLSLPTPTPTEPPQVRGLISGLKFNDFNNNGVRTEGEPGLADWGIELLTSPDSYFIASAQTNASGSYAFNDLALGFYVVKEISRSGWLETLPASPSYYLVNLSPEKSATGKDFGNFNPPKIIGYKWYDLNGDGVWQMDDGLEPPLPGWTIALGKVGFSTFASSSAPEPVPVEIVALSLTSSGGSFSFSAVSSGNYKIFEEKRDFWLPTKPASRSDFLFDVAYGVGAASKQFDLNSFFDVFVEFTGRTEINADTGSNSLNFGNIEYSEFSGAKLALLNGNSASASEAIFVGDSEFLVPAGGGASRVVVSDDTIVSRDDGGAFNISQLISNNVDTSFISGLGAGLVVDGALQWGLPGISLKFSRPVAFGIFLGTAFNGQTFKVVRSLSPDSGWTSDGIGPPTTCIAADGYCSFTANKASYFGVIHAVSSVSGASGGGGGGSIFTPTPTPKSAEKEIILPIALEFTPVPTPFPGGQERIQAPAAGTEEIEEESSISEKPFISETRESGNLFAAAGALFALDAGKLWFAFLLIAVVLGLVYCLAEYLRRKNSNFKNVK